MDGDDRADDAARDHDVTGPLRSSKRDRLKGALSRTKSKFIKQTERHHEKEIEEHGDDVDAFLAAGRPSISSQYSIPSPSATLLHHHATPDLLSSTTSTIDSISPRPSTSDSSSFALPKQSPRKIVVPRIDVSNSQRYPAAQNVGSAETNTTYSGGSDFLRPEYQGRSLSSSSLAKGRRRGRGLSVTFIEAPPIVIGVGGDDAPAPPVEISKARARARSVSPVSRRSGQMTQSKEAPSRPLEVTSNGPRPIPVSQAQAQPQSLSQASPSIPTSHQEPPDILRPRALQRVQTGLESSSAVGVSDLDKEFAMTLRMDSPASSTASPAGPEIVAPKPYRPIQPPPVMEVPGGNEGEGEEASPARLQAEARVREAPHTQRYYSGHANIGQSPTERAQASVSSPPNGRGQRQV